MTHFIFAPTGLLKRRTKAYGDVHRELRATVRTEKPGHRIPDKRDRKAQQHFDFNRTGDLHG